MGKIPHLSLATFDSYGGFFSHSWLCWSLGKSQSLFIILASLVQWTIYNCIFITLLIKQLWREGSCFDTIKNFALFWIGQANVQAYQRLFPLVNFSVANVWSNEKPWPAIFLVLFVWISTLCAVGEGGIMIDSWLHLAKLLDLVFIQDSRTHAKPTTQFFC